MHETVAWALHGSGRRLRPGANLIGFMGKYDSGRYPSEPNRSRRLRLCDGVVAGYMARTVHETLDRTGSRWETQYRSLVERKVGTREF